MKECCAHRQHHCLTRSGQPSNSLYAIDVLQIAFGLVAIESVYLLFESRY
jgi:hypothetical protein